MVVFSSSWLLASLALLTSVVSCFRLVKHDESFTPDIVLRISLATIQLDCQARLSVLVNGTYPGPPIYLEPDVTTWIRVYNDADDNSTIHWHGLTQSTSPFSDGSPMAAQWPIPSGHFFDYELHPKASEAGTYFYHSHIGFQAVTASGGLIVKDAGAPPYQYDDEIIIEIGDFYPEDDSTIYAMLTDTPQQWPGDPSAIQVNGQSGTAPTVDNMTPDLSCQPYFINVDPGTTYRMRFIGGTAISMVTFAFDDHPELEIIAADGYYTEKYTTDHIQIDTGQRFDLLFTTKSQEELNSLGQTQFWVQFETRESDSVQRAYAILNYQTSASNTTSAANPTSTSSPTTTWSSAIALSSTSTLSPTSVWSSANTWTASTSTSNSASAWNSTLVRRQGGGPRGPFTWNPVQVPTEVSQVPAPTQSAVNQENPSNATLMSGNVPYIPVNPPLQLPYSEQWLEYALVNLPQPGYLQPIDASEVTRRITIGWTQLASANQSGRTIYLGSLPGENPGQDQGWSWWDQAPSGPTYPTPYLVDIYKYGQSAAPDYQRAIANGGVDPVLDVWPAQVGEVLEIVWQNEASDNGIYGVHPMHAHGGPYFDIGSGPGYYDADANNAKLSQLGWNGALRDTTLLYAPSPSGTPNVVDGWRAWRVRVTEDNAGVWMMHCHILQHIVMGQMTIWVFGDAQSIIQGSNGEEYQLQGYFTYGGNVVGSEGSGTKRGLQKKTPTVAHFYD